MKNRAFIIGLVVLVISAVVTAAVYARLPDQIPTHFNIHGQPDAFGSKSWAAFVMPAVIAVLLALFAALPWLSPRSFDIEPFRRTYDFIFVLLILMLAYIQALLIWAGLGAPLDVGRALLAGIFAFLALLGNVVGKVKRNFWMGVRTPWTLADERVWHSTHRLAARLLTAVGAIGFLWIVFGGRAVYAFVLLLLGAVAPCVYSFVLYKKVTGTNGNRSSIWIAGIIGTVTGLIAVAGVTWAFLAATPAPVDPPAEMVTKAEGLVRSLNAGDFQRPMDDFDPQLQSALPPDELRGAWEGIVGQFGTYQRQTGTRAQRHGKHTIIFLKSAFSRGSVDIKVVFDSQTRISGLWFAPAGPF